MRRRRIVIETPTPERFAEKVRGVYALARLGMGAFRVRQFIHRKPVLSAFLGMGTGFLLARAFGSRR